ncbi:lysozyme-like protein [Meira miltonrushii]|uniref:Lysozyme-like protein n=1 Tax=Meira miltonrushii TaxID=1280837 RepID=A0A316VFX8_9BASI|nr:lysozyme-like protein [Meira miltonrushii]PWN36519.1 lysozyme-like protein [Meira miltonrushii]
MKHSSFSMVRVFALSVFILLAMTHLSEGLDKRSVHSPHIRRKQDHKHDKNDKHHHKPDKHKDDHGKDHKHDGKKDKDHHKGKPKDDHPKGKPKDDHHKDKNDKDSGNNSKGQKSKGGNQGDDNDNKKSGLNLDLTTKGGKKGGLGIGIGVGGLLTDVFHGAQCPKPNANKQSPNGKIGFLNCGLNTPGGWDPPPVQLKQVKVMPGPQAIKQPAFKACAKYYKHFKAASDKYGIPEIVLMSFAMQESSCKPYTHGANGEIGMMQVTPQNCKDLGVQPQDSWDPHTNVDLGARMFMKNLNQSGGNVLLAVGSYNGWEKGMTKQSAENTQYGCMAQKNLDYLNQFMNGWIQGKDGHSKEFLVYNNLAKCHGHN